MKKLSLLAASIGLILGGCGGSDDNPVAPATFAVKAIDGYLMHAEVYAGANCETLLGETDLNGDFSVDTQYQAETLCVKAVANKTIDSSRGIVTKSFELKAPANSSVISPITDLVVDALASDSSLTLETAKEAVKTQFEVLSSDSATLFGDYIAKAEAGDQAAKGITVIGETLVDNGNAAKEQLEQLVNIVAEKVEAGDGEIDNFNPVIGNDGNFTANHRPHLTLDKAEQDKLSEIEIELGQEIQPINLDVFADVDNDSFTISVKDEDGRPLKFLGLAFDPKTKVLTGKPVKAEEIELHVYATDKHGTRSYPLEIEIDVNSPNQAPVVDTEERAEIQQELNKLAAIQGVSIDKTIDLGDLFDDADDDNLKLSVKSDIPGLTLSIVQDDELKIVGTPTHAGAFTFTVIADDTVNGAVSAEFTFTVANNDITPEPSHPLVGKTWFTTEYGSDYGQGNTAYSRVWCDTFKFADGKVFMNARSPANLTECSAEATENVGTYKVVDGKLNVSFAMEDGEVEHTNITASDALVGIGDGAQMVSMFDERYTFFTNDADAEKRLNLKSDGSAEERMFTAELPAAVDGKYQLGLISVQMVDKGNGFANASVYFDVQGTDFTCAEVNEFYSLGFTDGKQYYGTNLFEDQEENKYCVASTSVFKAAKGTIYSVIGVTHDEQAQYAESIKANITWTGVGNND